ncbi:MAG: SufS family cysteine desulfurase [Oligoflexales bacterium]|nr:SufS family cysteine desulfurase [Oligoflexales bacterium]
MLAVSGFDPGKVRSQFPIFQQQEPLHYLDSAATSQKPQSVIDAVNHAYTKLNANVHRGVYRLSEAATKAFEDTRDKIAQFLGNVPREQVIFTSGTTASINLVARSWGESELKAGDEIVLTVSEHHSNLVPWHQLAAKIGIVIKYIPLKDNLRLDLEAAKELISSKTKLVACAHVSNVLGIIHPIKEVIALAKKVGAKTLIDGAQAVPHLSTSLSELDCDFYCFSSHKMLGPTGVGVLYGKKQVLDAMPPFLGGGDMIESVSLEGSTYAPLPYKFEAGTPAIAEVIGLGAAVDFLTSLDRQSALEHDRQLGQYAFESLVNNPHVTLHTQPGDDWIGTLTFTHKVIHPHDLAAFQDSQGVCIRAGHHCAQPLMSILKSPATTRMSPYIYNDRSDIDAFLAAIAKAEDVFVNH